ncbi:Adenylosuccinate lyase @ SAICAR lyase [hydrothermal vent metagenome]|uniref:Adenylosuccinate lyase n=1 Tax=hydrothermal vent metagenome TaxID=652676 RepID=A0A3B1DZB0_9ZZZZ
MESIQALTVLDGRYKKLTENLWEIFSEYGLMHHRIFVETKWLVFLAKELNLFSLNDEQVEKIKSIVEDFNVKQADQVKEIERTTNHDVKAVEYYIKQQLEAKGLQDVKEWVHFACTSEDINNTAYAVMLGAGRNFIRKILKEVLTKIEDSAKEYKSIPMMSRTHGQPASPTTVGKELINFAWRLRHELEQLEKVDIKAKMNGATGNFNAHHFVYPEIDWIDASRKFIADYLQVTPLLFTTQINPNHSISQILHVNMRLAATIVDLNRDMWGYISLGYFKQKIKEGEVGSSTMPHKVNPIDFENGEGNMGMAIAMMEHMSIKLLTSRFQRDLTDSTVLRNLGTLFGYFVIGLKNTLKGLNKIDLNEARIVEDLENNLELLAEPIQTAMRVFGEENPYEKLKELTQGTKITQESLNTFITALESVPDAVKEKMKTLKPSAYTGLAEKLVEEYF